MRRAQSVRNYGRPSVSLAADDLGLLRETDEPTEDTLRRQLLDKDRENDKLQTTILTLQAQLNQRPPIETIQELEKEYKNLDLILQGTQRENERCMAELERTRAREKMLEAALAKLAGENWQSALDIAPSSSTFAARAIGSSIMQRVGTPSIPPQSTADSSQPSQASQAAVESTLSQIEQIRLLVMGMEQRLETREEKLAKTIERAEAEGKRFETMRGEVLAG
ncbi:hypothetical protein BV22DRAFT_1062122 [Leucogyrophana mollusca]|uniref:Uncharacterized protein n=1 Tax=Leucogyrophana mollusca TaxID=85980 RepID=A0ACB8BNN5_9AGAM|nr:hypothetical protein BV22DRAFT_1062122 [Leucogyrophana mollusca]